jgi:hypothetical protein
MAFLSTLGRPVAALGLAAALFVGCNSAPVLDNDRLQQVIQQGLLNQTGVSATVSCPDNRPIQPGDTFVCTAQTEDGSNLQITVVQQDNVGNVNWSVSGVS